MVQHYRSGRGTMVCHESGDASTEDLRQAADRLTTRDIAGRQDRSTEVKVKTDRPESDVVEVPRDDAATTPLFPDDELGGYRTRWDAIQTGSSTNLVGR